MPFMRRLASLAQSACSSISTALTRSAPSLKAAIERMGRQPAQAEGGSGVAAGAESEPGVELDDSRVRIGRLRPAWHDPQVGSALDGLKMLPVSLFPILFLQAVLAQTADQVTRQRRADLLVQNFGGVRCVEGRGNNRLPPHRRGAGQRFVDRFVAGVGERQAEGAEVLHQFLDLLEFGGLAIQAELPPAHRPGLAGRFSMTKSPAAIMDRSARSRAGAGRGTAPNNSPCCKSYER
jgi:hypothetical protein